MSEIISNDASYQVIVTHGDTLTFIVMAWARIAVEAIGWLAFRSTPGGITLLVEDDYFHNRGVSFINKVDHLQ